MLGSRAYCTHMPRRPHPNVDDPLSEPTVRRRLWAAYLKAGHSRASFARALGITYHALDAWDSEKSMPDLENFAKAVALVEFTADELLYGQQASTSNGERRTDERVLAELVHLRQLVTKLLDRRATRPKRRKL